MKVPPKRKGNGAVLCYSGAVRVALNESPSEKEGKLFTTDPLEEDQTIPQ